MSLPYSLYENPFRKKEYMASPRPRQIYKLKDLAKRMESAYGRRYSETELINFLEFLSREVEDILQEGSSLHLPFIKISASISGKFKDTQDKIDARRHKVEVNVNPGTRLKGMAKGIKTTRVTPSLPSPCIKEVHDLVQDCKNTGLTIGHPAKLFGIHLKVNEADPRQGVFFINEENQAFAATTVYQTTSSRLFFKVPETLQPGTYTLEVRAIVGNSTVVRSGSYCKQLTLSILTS